jgi:(S)-2-hydroxyglutarate dehydrogenase
MEEAAVGIIGGGILGLATAYQLTQRTPARRVVVLEKEAELAHHQTGHNSGVLHSGIYYKPGSLKAINCREGKKAMEAFCATEGIDYEICGKVIVATNERELPALQTIYERGQANGVTCALIDQEHLRELEPAAAGIKAIHVPESGIVNYKQVCQRLAERIQERDGRIVTRAQVTGIRQQSGQVILQTRAGDFAVDYVVNCAGLYSDRMAAMSGVRPDVKIVPFRGEYYEVKPQAQHVCRNLIYPVPDPSFPFLGVHFTRMIEGGIECGPNAVLAFAREGYTKADINLRDLAETLTYSGFLRMASKYWQTGMGEMWRSISKAAFVRALQHLIPEIREADLEAAPAGVRAQAIAPDGAMVDDFMIQETERMVHVCNAPSPAATASLNIGRLIVDKLAQRFD